MHFDGKTLTATCSKAELKALLEHASEDELRPHVASVCFDLVNNCAVATDGHRLARCAFDESSTEPAKSRLPKSGSVLVPRKALAKALRVLGEAGARIDFDKSTITDAEGDDPVSIGFVAVDREFPPYLQVIPKFDGRRAGVSQRLDARYLADLVHVAKAVEHNRIDIFPAPSCLDPFVLVLSGDSVWTVVIMPMRGGAEVSLENCVNVTPRAVPAAKGEAKSTGKSTAKSTGKHPKSWLGGEAAKAS